MRVGIITFHCSYNFGSALQAQALEQAITNLDHESLIIDYRSENYYLNYKIVNPEHPRTTTKRLLHFGSFMRREKSFESFFEKNYRMTERVYTYRHEGRLDELSGQFDCFVCGSDQIWNLDATRGVVGPFFLSFAGDKRRVAYAPSLAHTSFKPEYFDRKKVASLLEKFDAISVREPETVGIFQPLVDKRIEVAVDPTMLLGTESYASMVAETPVDGPYVFVYLLRECPELAESAAALAEREDSHVVYVSDSDLPIPGATNLFGIGPDQFVSLVAHADAVLTNSFHATVFSTKFHTPFRAFVADESSSRIRDLLENLGLEGCMSNTVDSSMPGEQDWDSADTCAEGLRADSLRFLREALS